MSSSCVKLDEELELKRRRIIEALEGWLDDKDYSTLRRLLDSPESYNIRDKRGNTLLHVAILYTFDTSAFDYLLSLGDYPIDAVNNQGETALITALCNHNDRIFTRDKYFAFKLIEKGADIHRVCNGNGRTLLHWAIQKRYLDLAKLLLEKGVDLNRQDRYGYTPLQVCCQCCHHQDLVEGVAMLLYYGADPTIRNEEGRTAFDYTITNGNNRYVTEAAESLFYYLFDHYIEYDIDAKILLGAAFVESPFFEQLLQVTKIFINDSEDDRIQFDCMHLFIIKPKYLQVFLEKFDYIVRHMLNQRPTKNISFYCCWEPIYAENFYILFESKLQSEFVEWMCTVGTSRVVQLWLRHRKEMDESITEIICFLLSYRMTILTQDLHLVFKEWGFCELFKLLLHMDVTDDGYNGDKKDLIPRLLYDFSIDIQKLIDEPLGMTTRNLRQILPHFAIPKLKHISFEDEDVMKKIQNQPEIPLLVEMARNVFRRYFIQKLNIVNTRKFYTLLNFLPISSYHKKLISLEAELY